VAFFGQSLAKKVGHACFVFYDQQLHRHGRQKTLRALPQFKAAASAPLGYLKKILTLNSIAVAD
jgi:hypothetical protein